MCSVFVFVDAWKQSLYAGPEVNKDLATRMSWVYRRAGTAMFITSATTCASFIATALSSSMPDLQVLLYYYTTRLLDEYTRRVY